MKKRKIVIVGAGHNGLVAACYLAKAGHQVTVFEKRPMVGGCCITDETTFPGFKISSAAYLNSLFLSQIVEDLNLKKYGYEVIRRDPSSFTPLPGGVLGLVGGRYFFLGKDREFNIEQIRKFSELDAKKYPKYEAVLDKIASFVDYTLTITPPNIFPPDFSDMKKIIQLLRRFLKLGPINGYNFLKLLQCDAADFLDSWFESDTLKVTLLTDAIIGAMDFSGYVLLHHIMGEAGGTRGIWGYQRGGMGSLTKALAEAASDLGVTIVTEQPVRNIFVLSEKHDNKSLSILTDNGEITLADIVISNADPRQTSRLVCPHVKIDKFKNKTERLDFSSAVMKVNLTLSGLPSFRCLPGVSLGPQHKGTIHIAPSVEYIKKAAREGRQGIPSVEPILEITIPSVLDKTLAPSGHHVMNIFVQYTPYHLKEGSWDDLKERYFEKNILGMLRKYVENIDDIITGVQILSPLDLERDFSLSEGNIFHGAMTLRQLFSFRPLPGYANYRTPVNGLYLCGAGTHPGGGIIGACGLNAAREIIKDLEKEGNND